MRSFLSNILSLMAGNVLTLAVNFVFSIALVTRLSDAEYGLQGALVAFTGIVMMLAFLGIFNVTSRELTGKSPEQQHEIYNSIFSLELLLATVVCVVAALVAWLLNSFPGAQFTVLLLALFTLVLSYAPIAPTEAFLIVRGQMWRMAVLQTSYAIWSCLAGTIILFLGGGIGPIYIALTLLSLVTLVLYMRQSRRLVPGGPRLVFRPKEWRYYLGEALPGGLGGFFFTTTRTIGTYLVYTFVVQPQAGIQAGYMAVSYMLIQAVSLIVWVPYAVSILPVMTRLLTESRERLIWLTSRSLTWLLALTLPAALGAVLLAPGILRLLGESKVDAAPTLSLFIWTLPLGVMVELFFRIMLVIGQQRVYVVAAALGAVFNILLCLLLIPLYGVLGAAVAAVVGIVVTAAACAWKLRPWLKIDPADLIRLGISLVGMAVSVVLTKGALVVVPISIGALVYTASAVLLGVFKIQDWQAARELLAVGPQHAANTDFSPEGV